MLRRMRRILSVVVLMLFFFGMSSGCARHSGNGVVGKWYNKNNKCLDIRSDGTYKLEDSYGTGKWKLLDDKETYEFLDYYGDSQETKIYSDDGGKYLDFGYYGDFYKDSFPFESGQNNTDVSEGNTDIAERETEIQVLRAISAGSSFFKVEFQVGDEKYCGIADATGQIVYYTDQYSISEGPFGSEAWNGLDFTPMDDASGYICESNGEKTEYTIINSEGTKKTFSEEDFDVILGSGGGYLLVYKNTGNISKEEYSYGLINSDGNWEIPLMPGDKIEIVGEYVYAGEKVFVYTGYRLNKYYAIVFDCANNRTIGLYNCAVLSDLVYNGQFIVCEKGWSAGVSIPYDSENIEGLPSHSSYLFSTDGSYQEIPEISAASDRVAIYEDSGFYQIWDLATDMVTKYEDFPETSIVRYSCVDNYVFFIIRGADGNFYFTVLDSKGVQQFEPRININNVEFYGDRIICQTKNGYYEMLDNKGNLLISENKKCLSLEIHGNTVSGKTEYNTVSFDKDGNEIVFHF